MAGRHSNRDKCNWSMRRRYGELFKWRHDDLSLTTHYNDMKMALGQISGKDVRHCIGRFFQHNGGIWDWGRKPIGKCLNRFDFNGILELQRQVRRNVYTGQKKAILTLLRIISEVLRWPSCALFIIAVFKSSMSQSAYVGMDCTLRSPSTRK